MGSGVTGGIGKRAGLAAAMLALLHCSAPAGAGDRPTLTPALLESLVETHRGKVILIDYWATWCPPCRTAAPELDALYRSLGGQGLEVVGVSFDREEKPLEEFIARHDLSYPVYLGSAGLRLLQDLSALPTTVLIARDGSAAGRFIGHLPRVTLERKIRVLLEENRGARDGTVVSPVPGGAQ